VTSASWSRRARRELLDAADWIADDNPEAADRLIDTAQRAAALIAARPGVGVRRPKLAPEIYRFFSLRGFPYIIVYSTADRPPRIVRVVHGARDLPTVLSDLR
jgi:toxin ParE1/3/4